MPEKTLDERLAELRKKHAYLDLLAIPYYNQRSPHLTTSELIWNIITDYDDAFNNKEKYPYSIQLYNDLNKLVNP